MTLKNSFFNSMREDRKRRTWTIVVFGLICFMMTAVFELLGLESYGHISNAVGFQNHIYEFTEDGMLVLYYMAAIGAAMLYGFQGFGWLTKRQQVDFYHSQPMKKEKRFLIQYINGFLLFEIPMLLHILIGAFLIGIRGYLDLVVIMNLGINILVFTLVFLLCYSLVITAVMLTGNLIVSFLAAGVLGFSASVVRLLAAGYYEAYFETYVSDFASPLASLAYFSPWERIYAMADSLSSVDKSALPIQMFYVLLHILFFFATAYFLYKKRPSECAGKALAFPIFGDLIRFLMVIPGAMAFGMLFAAWNGNNGIFWLYFGTIAGAVFTHGFMEVIFHFDIRAALKKKGQLVISVILMTAIVSIFRFDLFSYDRFLPKQDEIKAVSYYINVGEYIDYYYPLDENGIPYGVAEVYDDGRHMSRKDYQLSVSKRQDAEPVLKMIEGHLNHEEAASSSDRVYFLVCYEMKKGAPQYRKYYMERDYVKTALEEIYHTEEGKQVLYPYYNLTGERVETVSVFTPVMVADQFLELDSREIEELAECYRKDLKDRTVNRFFEDRILGRVTFHYLKKGGGTLELNFFVSEADKRINVFLERHGMSLQFPGENYTVESATLYSPYGMEETKDHPFWQGRSEVILTKKEIEPMLPYVVSDQFMMGGYREYPFHMTMMVRNHANGHVREVYCYLDSANAPEYLLMK